MPVLNDEKLKNLYATMLKCRLLAERLQSLQPSARKAYGPNPCRCLGGRGVFRWSVL